MSCRATFTNLNVSKLSSFTNLEYSERNLSPPPPLPCRLMHDDADIEIQLEDSCTIDSMGRGGFSLLFQNYSGTRSLI